MRNNGLARSLGKFLATYVAGRQSWYMTSADLRRYLDWPPPQAARSSGSRPRPTCPPWARSQDE